MAALAGACASSVGSKNLTYEERAEFAYKQADAMMKERAKWDFGGDPENYPSNETIKQMLREAIERKYNHRILYNDSIENLIDHLETGLPL